MKKELLENNWQEKSLSKLVGIFKSEKLVQAIILVGSLADENIETDKWSDIDLKIVLDKKLLNKYYFDLDYFKEFGNIFSIEKNESENFYTIRICLDNFQRFDITFITSGIFEIEKWHIIGEYKVLYSNIENINERIDDIKHKKWKGIDLENLKSFQESFWYKANNSIVKVMRNDLIIAHHLALDLARDCLVLQMILRDKKFDTNIHRTGGFGNKIIEDLFIENNKDSKKYILESIKKYGKLFEELSIKLGLKSNKYNILLKFIEEAKN